jgi:hypothetical protein
VSVSACPIRILIRIQESQINADPCASGSATLRRHTYIPYCTWPPIIYRVVWYLYLSVWCTDVRREKDCFTLFTICNYSELHNIYKTESVSLCRVTDILLSASECYFWNFCSNRWWRVGAVWHIYVIFEHSRRCHRQGSGSGFLLDVPGSCLWKIAGIRYSWFRSY